MKQITELTEDKSVISSNYDTAEKKLQIAMNIALKNKFIFGQLWCINSVLASNNHFGAPQAVKDRTHKTIDSMYQLSLKDAEWAKYKYYACYLIARKFTYENKLDSSRLYILESLKINPGDSELIYMNFEQLATINYELGNTPMAISYQTKVVSRNKQMKDTLSLILNTINLAAFYNDANDTTAILSNYRNAMNYILIDSNKYFDYQLMCLFNIGAYFGNNSKMLDSAIYYHERCLNLFKLHPGKYTSKILEIKLSLAKKYINKKNTRMGNKYFDEVAAEVNDNPDKNDPTLFRSYWRAKSFIYESRGDWKESFNFMTKVYDYNDDIREKELNLQFQDLEKELKKLSAEKTIAEKESKINRQKQINTAWSSIAVILSLSSIGIYRNLKQKQKLEKINNEKKILNSKLDERDRIAKEMHDNMGSTITSMHMALELFNQNPTDLSNKMRINDISDELHQQMNEAIWRMNTGNDYLQNLCAYIYKFSRKFLSQAGIQHNITTNIPEELIPMSGTMRHILYLSTKEILNNIVKHAEANSVSIQIDYQDEILTINIKDDGKGFNMEMQEKRYLGNGLKNIEKNIQDLGGKVHWTIASGTGVEIILPLNFVQND
jgi:signal transduction histidine kinase